MDISKSIFFTEYRKAFKAFDKRNRGETQVENVGKLLSCLGFNFSASEIKEFSAQLEVNGRGFYYGFAIGN